MKTYKVKIMTVLDSKPTKSVGRFEENKFSVGGHQFCWNAVQNWSEPTILDKMQSIKGNWKTKLNTFVQLGCLFAKLPRLFVRDCRYFLPCKWKTIVNPHYLDIFSNSCKLTVSMPKSAYPSCGDHSFWGKKPFLKGQRASFTWANSLL